MEPIFIGVGAPGETNASTSIARPVALVSALKFLRQPNRKRRSHFSGDRA
jgi:hypothetical protein